MERAELKTVLRATGCAIERGNCVFLCDPNWSGAERDEAARQMGLADARARERPAGGGQAQAASDGWLCVRTGGSGGAMKFARHDEGTLSAAVRGFCAHFGTKRVNAIDVLPAHHVSGLMSRVRCAATGGRHLAWEWKRLESGELPGLGDNDWVVSLVPTQLQRLLASAECLGWLRQLRTVFVSGGPVWPELADAAADAGLRVSLSYGMTETAAMIAALHPEEFLAGGRSCGTVLPHGRVAIDPAENVLQVAGESLFRGYWPGWREEREFTTEDLGRIDERGRLHILGRRDTLIISGGKKVNPAEVEAALRASGEFTDVAVIGVPDREWGQVAVACYPREKGSAPDFAKAVERLAGYQKPKRFLAVERWPRNAQGKLNRAALMRLVAEA